MPKFNGQRVNRNNGSGSGNNSPSLPRLPFTPSSAPSEPAKYDPEKTADYAKKRDFHNSKVQSSEPSNFSPMKPSSWANEGMRDANYTRENHKSEADKYGKLHDEQMGMLQQEIKNRPLPRIPGNPSAGFLKK
jgi:hypothetical protein